ncbi:hypothetical protein MNB_SUP05-SYMBIONT-5-82 [hydrothermal vent metagenome]|uniref:Uncharacterized protein n=1 Tax=hydrothermal vent metagenome TaxID=652676 RepID=A0A1W1E4W9_9ZZZZ
MKLLLALLFGVMAIVYLNYAPNKSFQPTANARRLNLIVMCGKTSE